MEWLFGPARRGLTKEELAGLRTRSELLMKAADAYEYVKDGRQLSAEAWFRMMGYPHKSLDILDFMQYVHPQDCDIYPMERAVGRAKPGDSICAEVRFRNAEDRYIWFRVCSRNVAVGGRVVSLGIVMNIDRLKRLEEYALQGDRLSAVGRVACGVAHDISNHLATVQTSLGLLMTVSDEALRRKYASYMQEAAANATGLLKSLVRFSRGDEEGYAVFGMNAMLLQSKELLERALFREARLTYENTAGADRVCGSYYELQNVILNIGLNARDALAEAGGDIAIRAWTSDSNPQKPGDSRGWYCVSVRDNGCGMSEATRARIFDPFFTTKPQGKGSGLGLYTAWGNVRRHGGTISVESAEGRGTEFLVAIPLAEENVLPAEQARRTVS